MTHNLEATVFVYRSYKDKSIKAEYLEKARLLEESPDWEHIATLEPRMWIECNYAAIEQAQKQEPVAWPCVIETADFEEDTITLKMQTSDYSIGVGLHWLSTSPPQRQPLTDEQIIAVVPDTGTPMSLGEAFYKFARAIEAAHGIKGEA